MDNLRCKNCKYLEDYSLDGCNKCNNCGWEHGEHSNFEARKEDSDDQES